MLAFELRLTRLLMASDITVVIADATQTLAIKAGLPLSGRVTWFTAGMSSLLFLGLLGALIVGR